MNDLYTAIASRMFGVQEKNVTAIMRNVAKNSAHAKNYGKGSKVQKPLLEGMITVKCPCCSTMTVVILRSDEELKEAHNGSSSKQR